MNSTISVNGSALWTAGECPLENIAMTAKDTIEQYKELDEVQLGNLDDTPLDSRNRHIEDQLDALETLASSSTATTPTGAMFQLIVAIKDLQTVSNICDESEKRENDDDLEKALRRVQRCLYAVMAYIESQAGFTHDSVGYDFYVSELYNPFIPLTKITERLKKSKVYQEPSAEKQVA
jgi:hypothetical protein